MLSALTDGAGLSVVDCTSTAPGLFESPPLEGAPVPAGVAWGGQTQRPISHTRSSLQSKSDPQLTGLRGAWARQPDRQAISMAAVGRSLFANDQLMDGARRFELIT